MTTAFPHAMPCAQSKTVRHNLTEVLVTCDICPQVAARVLAVITAQSIEPLSIDFRRKLRSIELRVQVGDGRRTAADMLASTIAEVIAVRAVSFSEASI
jgi:hypothetical protein